MGKGDGNGTRWAELAGIMTALVAASAFAMSTFATKVENDAMHAGTNQRLDRIEAKVDRLLEHAR